MRLICPSCEAQYEVADNVIPPAGRDVQCSNCGTTWFQEPVRAKVPAAQAAPARPAPPPPPVVEEQSQDQDTPNWRAESRDHLQPPPAPRVSEDAASILREEAMRELRARLSERPKVEAQPDYGMMPPIAEPVMEAPPPEPEKPPVTPSRVTSRRNLPDVQDIDTTLAAHGEPVPKEAAAVAATAVAYRRSFRSGFGLSLAAGIAAAAVYVYAPQIATRVPAAEPALRAYVAQADSLRVRLAQTVDALIGKAGA